MALTADEQHELDSLEYDKLLSEKHAASQAAVQSPTIAPAADPYAPDAPYKEDPLHPRNSAISGVLGGQARGLEIPGSQGVVNAAIEGGAPAVGQTLGAMTGPLAPVAIPVLGGIGGALGDIVTQLRGDKPFSVGRVIGSAITGAIPGEPIVAGGIKATATALGKQGLKFAAGEGVATESQSLADSGQLANAGDVALRMGAAAIAPTVAHGIAGAAGVASRASRAVTSEDITSLQRQRLQDLRDTGENFVVAPQSLDEGNPIARKLTTTDTTMQQAAKTNAISSQKLVREDLGLPRSSAPFKDGEFTAIRQQYAEPYQAIDKISNDAKDAIKQVQTSMSENDFRGFMATPAGQALDYAAGADVNQLKALRLQAQKAFAASKSNPQAYADYEAASAGADALENQIDHVATASGDADLVNRLRDARKKIAISYTVQNATNTGTGIVDPAYLGRQLDGAQGGKLSGNIRKIAAAAQAFPGQFADTTNLGGSREYRFKSVIGEVISSLGKPASKVLLSDISQNKLLGITPANRAEFMRDFSRYLVENSGKQAIDSQP